MDEVGHTDCAKVEREENGESGWVWDLRREFVKNVKMAGNKLNAFCGFLHFFKIISTSHSLLGTLGCESWFAVDLGIVRRFASIGEKSGEL